MKDKTDEKEQNGKGIIKMLIGWFKEAVESFRYKYVSEKETEQLLSNHLESLLRAFGGGDKTIVLGQVPAQDQTSILKELYLCLPEKASDSPDKWHFALSGTKEKMLKIMMEKWNPSDHSDESRDIFSFFVSRFGADRAEEQKIVDNLFRLRLAGASVEDVEDIERWIKFLDPSSLKIHALGRRLAMARASVGGIELAFKDMQNSIITSALDLEDVDEVLFKALKPAIKAVVDKQEAIHDFFHKLVYVGIRTCLKLTDDEGISFELTDTDSVEIRIVKKMEQGDLANQSWHYRGVSQKVFIKMEEYGLHPRKGKTVMIYGRKITLEIVIFDENGIEMFRKSRDAKG